MYAGDAAVCDPKTFYECALVRLDDYARDNIAATCNCPRQCRHLSYNHDISQAVPSNYFVKFVKTLNNFNRTVDEIRYDYCSIEVSQRVRQRVFRRC